MIHLDLFSGIGGFSLGLKMAGFEFEKTYYSDIDEYANKVYANNFPDAIPLGDVTKVTLDTLVNILYDGDTNTVGQENDMAYQKAGYENAVELYNSGLSIQNVADFYGITRQGMWDILKRRGCIFRDQLKFGNKNHFYRGGEKASDKAQNLLEHAIEKGIVVKKTHCEKCGCSGEFKDGRSKIQGHHPDYNKPLDVLWLCQSCHHEWHKNHKPIERKEVPKEAKQKDVIITAGFP